MLEGEIGYFDLEAFVRAEKCSVVHETSIFNHIKTDWDGPGKDQNYRLRTHGSTCFGAVYFLDVVLVQAGDTERLHSVLSLA